MFYSLICIFCEKKFKDRNVLKEHMRKKLHKRINPNNKEYDKYYIQNYSISPSKNIDRTVIFLLKMLNLNNFINLFIYLGKQGSYK